MRAVRAVAMVEEMQPWVHRVRDGIPFRHNQSFEYTGPIGEMRVITRLWRRRTGQSWVSCWLRSERVL